MAIGVLVLLIALATAIGFWRFHHRKRLRLVELARAATLTQEADQLDALLSRCIHECDSSDAEIARQYREGYRLLQSGKAQEGVKRINGAVFQALDNSPNDPDVKMHFLSWALQTVYTERGLLDRKNAALNDKIIRRARQLTQAFPKEPRAYLELGFGLKILGYGQLDTIRAYHDCLVKNPVSKRCRTAYADEVKGYQAPKCSENGVSPDLKMYLANLKKTGQFRVKMKTSFGQTLFRETTPVVSGKDFDQVALSVDPVSTRFLINLTATPEARHTLALATANIQGDFMIVTLDKRVLLAAMIQSSISDGRLQITPKGQSAKKLYHALCIKESRARLPADLAI